MSASIKNILVSVLINFTFACTSPNSTIPNSQTDVEGQKDVGIETQYDFAALDSDQNILDVAVSVHDADISSDMFIYSPDMGVSEKDMSYSSPPICGNATIEEDEECDDGNNNNGDLCTNDCLFPRCGDGYINQPLEECDDGNSNNNDICTINCTLSRCGDGILNNTIEECDDGDQRRETCSDGESQCLICNQRCELIELNLSFCGDGIRDSQELCDGQLGCPSDCGIPCLNSTGGCPDLEWVNIDGGTFSMGNSGSTITEPVRLVTLRSFQIMKSEVTVEKYRLCVDAGVCPAPTVFYPGCTWEFGDQLPISCVTWYMAQSFAKWVGARLPSEAEWEYVATNGGTTDYAWGNNTPTCDLSTQACALSGSLVNVCSKPNGNSSHGVCDLNDGVIEWTGDKYIDHYNIDEVIGRIIGNNTQNSYRSIRGGNSSIGNGYVAHSRTRYGSCRGTNPCNHVGFRLVRDLDLDNDGITGTLDCDDLDATNTRVDDCDFDTILKDLDCDDTDDFKGSYLNDADCLGYQPPCATSSVGCPDIDFVMLPDGDFMMGADDVIQGLPVHLVSVPRFKMMRSEITVGMYRMCVSTGYCSAYICSSSIEVCNYQQQREDHPINLLTWQDTMKFASWVGARLPTEAEWEYAASRGDVAQRYIWGNIDPTCMYSNYTGCLSSTASVCSFPLSHTIDGLCDMAGNVWEWTQDEWHDNYIGAPNNGVAWCSNDVCPDNSLHINYRQNDTTKRVLRSGSFLGSILNLRISDRVGISFTPHFHYSHTGGRLARSIMNQSE